MQGHPPRPSPAGPGISQPYLFRLFGTKKDLFVATYDLVGDRIIRESDLGQ